MINEEVTKEAMESTKQGVILAIKVIKELNNLEKAAKEQMEVYLGKVEKGVQGNQVKLKDLYKKGQLENVEVDKVNLRALKKELNKYGVKFSVMKDRETKGYTLFFQANARSLIDKAFKNILMEGKERDKPSTIKKLDDCRKKVSKSLGRNKERTKAANKSMAVERELH